MGEHALPRDGVFLRFKRFRLRRDQCRHARQSFEGGTCVHEPSRDISASKSYLSCARSRSSYWRVALHTFDDVDDHDSGHGCHFLLYPITRFGDHRSALWVTDSVARDQRGREPCERGMSFSGERRERTMLCPTRTTAGASDLSGNMVLSNRTRSSAMLGSDMSTTGSLSPDDTADGGSASRVRPGVTIASQTHETCHHARSRRWNSP
jgi:hypothetical protein